MNFILTIVIYSFSHGAIATIQQEHQSLESCIVAGDFIIKNINNQSAYTFNSNNYSKTKILSSTCTKNK